MEEALKIENLNFSYKNPPKVISYFIGKKGKEVSALKDINIKLKKGEKVAIMGKNGAGKTTLLKIIVGLLKEDSGRIEIFGYSPSEESTKRIIGFAQSDERSFYYRLTVRENLFFYGGLWGLKEKYIKERLDELSDRLMIKNFIDENFFELSSGMKQKVSLCRALLHNPEILVLDEPTRSLDVIAQEEIIEILRSGFLKEKTIIISTHKVEESFLIAEKSLILKEGRNIYFGKPLKDEKDFVEMIEGSGD